MSFVGEEPTPGVGLFGPSVDAFDQRAEQLLEIIRSSKVAGRVFSPLVISVISVLSGI